MNIYDTILRQSLSGKKMIAALIDPDKPNEDDYKKIIEQATEAGIDFFFAGSSLIMGDNFERCLRILKQSAIPVIIFPGSHLQVSYNADAILFLSLISGRNAEMLIGRHVLAAPALKKSSLEIIPTGYMLIDSGSPTSVSYMSGTTPIPHDKDDIAVCTALAGQMLGLKLIYLDAGSGARFSVSKSMIKSVSSSIDVPLIVGGGITDPSMALAACDAGADVIVIGNALEKNPKLISELSAAVHSNALSNG